MTTAVDSNILAALWDKDDSLNAKAERALDSALDQGGLVVAAPVFAELLADPGRTEGFLDSFFERTGIVVDWNLTEGVWRAAGLAFQRYAARRRTHRGTGPRRILADFLIGAHAHANGFALLTLDHRLYRVAYPELRLFPA
jgi:predicted nucleic acid-binding protein